MILYHATDYKNLASISSNGLKRGVDGVVYGCKTPNDCLKFAHVHGVKKALVIKFQVDKENVVETFDHCYEFFKCRCYGATVDVPTDKIKGFSVYDLTAVGKR